jgi:hypothetical protein
MRKKYRHYKRTFVFTGAAAAAAAGSSVPFWFNLLSKKTKKKNIDDDVPDNANITVEQLNNEEPASKYLGLKVSFHEDENSDDDDNDDDDDDETSVYDDENVNEDSESVTLFLDKSRSCDSSTEDIENAMIFEKSNQTNHYYSDEDDDEEENDDGWSTDNGDDDDDDKDDEIVGEQQPTDKIIIDNNANGFNVDDRSSTNNSDWFGSIPFFYNNVEITKEPDCIANIDTLSIITESQQKETDTNEYHEKLHQTNRTKMFLSKLMCLNYIRRRLHERKDFNDIKNRKEMSDDDIEVEYKKERESIGSSNSRKKKMNIINRLRTLIANLRKKLKRQGNDSDYESLTGDIDDDILSVYSTALLGADALESNTVDAADAANGGAEAGTWQYYLSTILDPDMLCFEEHALNNNEKSMDTSNEDSP